jgi:selenium binding protein SBP56
MVEISRDGKWVYWTNSLYSSWDNQFYPEGVPGVEVMANANASGGLELAKDYRVRFPDGYRAHQIRLEGGDCSTDSFCYPRFDLRWTALDWTPAVLWLAVVASGLYHGVNPGMGWPLAVSAGLMERSSHALVAALGPLTPRQGGG